MKIPDEMLSAFINGELEGAERQRIELAIAHDRRIAQRVAKQRALRSRLHAALDDVLHQTARPARDTPNRLYPGSAQVIDLARARAARNYAGQRRRPRLAPRFLIAASLMAGAALGGLLTWLSASDSLTHYGDGTLVARGALIRALNEEITGQTSADAPIHVSSTYRAKDGGYCRTFTVTGSRPLVGLACRSGSEWRVETLLSNASAPALLLELNKNVNSMPISPVVEQQLRSRDWH